ncbi:type II toxin-antitoxin system VapC family toxin [Neolewinella lacunae]|uniref:Type II toxin-antitoxin system VapC family toxin n=1 Tax=Neolewinella lacunae TaxID=1517758 RepID=A0A923T8X3_9BACT|nr:type II toxin-antitoxin system VapC family toxin [Neolewinella lacunae]MBC6994976.1 type II toxin-antitoxin system VapC family toxin [Neolewinella lacunae]MDN3633253.1 type II toxin-antitoxin system VapC family toxin [Neolewinella lacunae]
MGRSYLIDTNAVIDLIAGKFTESGERWVEKIFDTEAVYLSIINRIELLGFQGSVEEMDALSSFVKSVTVLPLTEEVANQAIEIRRKKKIKLPDAVIAATALVFELTIISRNTKDF